MQVRRTRSLAAALALALSFGLAAPMLAQGIIEADIGVGYSAVNTTSWAGTTPWDWNQTSTTEYVQGFLAHGTVALGAELGYQNFFRYTVQYTGGGFPAYYTYGVHAWRLMALARFGQAHGIFADAGLGAEIFPGGTDAAVAGALGYMITAGKKLSVPIKVRGDLVLDKDAKLFPLTASVGLAYHLK